ncbi:MAG: hypothetical protein JO235_17595 [Chroococcidiopsidaceae cyanobacterium CP_BM_RX_35]|nr:hypothetical protein [Chroococcidiopsidaceae cyanobacterium CP_BM_RX_35]
MSLSRGNFCNLALVRERILSGLLVGKQSPEYKRTKAVIDRLIALVRVAMICWATLLVSRYVMAIDTVP